MSSPVTSRSEPSEGDSRLGRRRLLALGIDGLLIAAPLLPLPIVQWESLFPWPSFYRGVPGGMWGGLERAFYTFCAAVLGALAVLAIHTTFVLRQHCSLGLAHSDLAMQPARPWRWTLAYFVGGPAIGVAVGGVALFASDELERWWGTTDHLLSWVLFAVLLLFVHAVPVVGRGRRTLLDRLAGVHPEQASLSDYSRHSSQRVSLADLVLLATCLPIVVISLPQLEQYLPCCAGGLLGFASIAGLQLHALHTRGGLLGCLALRRSARARRSVRLELKRGGLER